MDETNSTPAASEPQPDTPEQAAQAPTTPPPAAEAPDPEPTADQTKAQFEAQPEEEVHAPTAAAQAELSGAGAQVGHEIDVTDAHVEQLGLGHLVMDDLGRVWHCIEDDAKRVLRFVGRLVP